MKFSRRGLLGGLLGLPVVGILGQEALAKREPLTALTQTLLPKTPIVIGDGFVLGADRSINGVGFVPHTVMICPAGTTTWTIQEVTPTPDAAWVFDGKYRGDG